MSESNAKIYAALVKARAEFKPVHFDKVNPHFRSRFASLAAINDAVVDSLAKNGLATIQPWKDMENGDVLLETILVHESGSEIRSSCRVVRTGKTDQQFGASCTYIRRYQLSSLLGVIGEDDDDGESNQGRVSPPVDIKPKVVAGPKISPKQLDEIHEWLLDFPDSAKALCDKFGIQEIAELEQKDFAFVISVFEKRKKVKEKS